MSYESKISQSLESEAYLSQEDLLKLDPHSISNICSILSCSADQIKDILPIKTGLTNKSYRFELEGDYALKGARDPHSNELFGDSFIYRIPSHQFDESMIFRSHEYQAELHAKELGLDPSFIHMDPQQGWKLAHYLPQAKACSYADLDKIDEGILLLKRLHEQNYSFARKLDLFAFLREAKALIDDKGLSPEHQNWIDQTYEMALQLEDAWNDELEKTQITMVHMDFWPRNLLAWSGGLALIDWEYCCCSHPLMDLATLSCQTTELSEEQIYHFFEHYFGQEELSEEQKLSVDLILALNPAFWMCWAMQLDLSDYSEEDFEIFKSYLEICLRYGAKALKALSKR